MRDHGRGPSRALDELAHRVRNGKRPGGRARVPPLLGRGAGMTPAPAIGFALPPAQRTLALLGAFLREEPDYYELAPETTWRPAAPDAPASAPLEPNGYHAAFRA